MCSKGIKHVFFRAGLHANSSRDSPWMIFLSSKHRDRYQRSSSWSVKARWSKDSTKFSTDLQRNSHDLPVSAERQVERDGAPTSAGQPLCPLLWKKTGKWKSGFLTCTCRSQSSSQNDLTSPINRCWKLPERGFPDFFNLAFSRNLETCLILK